MRRDVNGVMYFRRQFFGIRTRERRHNAMHEINVIPTRYYWSFVALGMLAQWLQPSGTGPQLTLTPVHVHR